MKYADLYEIDMGKQNEFESYIERNLKVSESRPMPVKMKPSSATTKKSFLDKLLSENTYL